MEMLQEAPARPRSEVQVIGVDSEKKHENCVRKRVEVVAVEVDEEESGRERLKRHRKEVAGRVWIPETWGQESLLKEWTDCLAFDRVLLPAGLVPAREALVDECRSATAASVHVANSC